MIIKSAKFSGDKVFRYTLWREWDSTKGFVMFIGLNPSTADEINDDPTIRRCIGFAQSWGFGALCMTNLFAFRATQPSDLQRARNPIGILNDEYLLFNSHRAKVIIAAWGVNGSLLGRDKKVMELIPELSYLKLTKNGYPSHPLYLPKTLKPIFWDIHISQKRISI